jgi:hypothetical protein
MKTAIYNKSEVNTYLETREEQAETVKQKLSTIQPDLAAIRSCLLAQQKK